VRARINIGIPHQIRALREQRGWSQSELGRRTKKPPNVINRLENPESGLNTIRTCLELASAFDVALIVKFVSFSRFLNEFQDVSPQQMEVPSFCNDPFLIVGDPRSQIFSMAYVPPPELRLNTTPVEYVVTNPQQHTGIVSEDLFLAQNVVAGPPLITPIGEIHAKEQ
jgi:transcriptional regulator with XRE-family HTH domain